MGNLDQNTAPSEQSFFKGTVTRITYRNEESGFGVVRAEADSSMNLGPGVFSTEATIVGEFPSTLSRGAFFIARGSWQTHPRFGKQFRAYSVQESDPTTVEAIEKYLASGAVKGLGPVLARRVIEAFGKEALKILDTNPKRLLSIPGIGKKKYHELVSSWEEKRALREVMLFFQEYGIGIGLAQRIARHYGDRAIETVRSNPYVLTRDVWGIGFQTADQIAQALGIEPTSSNRLSAGLVYTLERAADDGHCFLPLEVLLERAGKLLGTGELDLLESPLAEAVLRGDVVQDGINVYPPTLHRAETRLAKEVASRIGDLRRPVSEIASNIIKNVLASSISTPDVQSGTKVIHLSEQQQQALHLVAASSLVVITGGPGCGKTTVVQAITKLLRQAGLRVKLAAPTGRAAQRLAEVCSMEASTIHRLLGYEPTTRTFIHNDRDPLQLDAIVVDESSMIDTPLAASLFNAIPQGTRIIVVGDADQLPSVGPGLFLADLLSIEQVPRVNLTELFRRAQGSSITQVAHDINSARVPHIPQPDGKTKSDTYYLPAEDTVSAAELIEKLVVEQVPRKFGFAENDITVLTPMNKGELGAVALNQRLQAKLVPVTPGLPRVRVGEIEFRLGDRVCQRVNNYNIVAGGVFNGDQGRVIGIDAEAQEIVVRLWDNREVTYTREYFYQLDLAYALTIHRSQGSEVPAVVMALHDSHNILLERQLVYTGVTRAKRLLVIVGTKKALVTAAKRMRSRKRYTRLVERTRELLT